MSQLLINDYLRQLDVIKKACGSYRETIVREAFKDLLKSWGKQHGLVFLAEYPLKTATKANIAVDGALLHELRMPLGYWEAKDERDDLDEEIDKKLRKGYPQDNIIFSDDVNAVLIQRKEEVLRCDMTDTAKLAQLLKLFFGFERREIRDFRAAVEQFKQDLPAVLEALRSMIAAQEQTNASFRAGVAISFMVKRVTGAKDKKPARVFYVRRPEMETAEEKLAFLSNHPMNSLGFDEVQPDKASNWVNLTSNDFETLIPLASKETKASNAAAKERAVFKLHSLGMSTNRDEWLYDLSGTKLSEKVQFFLREYKSDKSCGSSLRPSIKWSETLKRRAVNGEEELFDKVRIVQGMYRPFFAVNAYHSGLLVDRPGLSGAMFPPGGVNTAIVYTQPGSQKPFCVCAAAGLVDLHFVGAAAGTECLPLSSFDGSGNRVDNITDWAFKQFTSHYKSEQPLPQPSSSGRGSKSARKITKESIFHYCYAVLHDPVYREKYAQNLKREYPRIPFYADFWQWADWGERLMALHIGYEKVEPFALARTDTPDAKARAAGQPPKAMLRADPVAGAITLDSETALRGVPADAWSYKLGNRSALDWVLDQYKERKPKDPTIREKFDTYRFADYKEKVIDLLARVTTVSLETVRIVHAMKEAAR